MTEYCYFPILKTRSSEIAAYTALENSVKDGILPIIEMTGALGYTYPKNYKIESLQKQRRPGDILGKIKKILDFTESRRFILDITDDESLKYDGLSDRNGGLLDHSNGYNASLAFLENDENFKQQVIPTIQFNTSFRSDVEQQIQSLDVSFDYVAIKLPAFVSGGATNSDVFNTSIQRIIDWILQYLKKSKLIVILDFGYMKDFVPHQNLITNGLVSVTDLSKIAALIPVSSSFPNFVTTVEKPIPITEVQVFECVRNTFPHAGKVFCGDYAAIHPTKYEMGGGGWIPRIDYIVRNNDGIPIEYDYFRGNKRNTSSEYINLARQVIRAKNYLPILNFPVAGEQRIAEKAANAPEGKAPSYWITVRSNIFMTSQYLHLKEQGSFLAL